MSQAVLELNNITCTFVSNDKGGVPYPAVRDAPYMSKTVSSSLSLVLQAVENRPCLMSPLAY